MPSGSRNDTHRNFIHAIEKNDPNTLCVLLVDSEEAIASELPVAHDGTPEGKTDRETQNAIVRRDHLVKRDKWNLDDIPPECVHLIVCCMETWIVADPERMAVVYGNGFHPDKLPNRRNLEEEPKADLNDKLARATKDTTRGAYSAKNNSKIRHASKLLEQIRAAQVARRCPRFATFTGWLRDQIDATGKR